MKKDVLIGIFTPLFFFLVENIMLYTIVLNEYSEKYAALHMRLIILLPALPGIALVFLLIRDSLKLYFKSLGICFVISMLFFLIYMGFRIDLMIFTKVTGSKEFGMGEGLLFAITMLSYLVSCFAGALFSGVITVVKKRVRIKVEN